MFFFVEKDLKSHVIPASCHGQGHLPHDQVAQSPVQAGLQHLQILVPFMYDPH